MVETNEIADGALDTLGCVIRTMGQHAFAIDSEPDQPLFSAICEQVARHVENGAAVPACDIPQSPGGHRQWSSIRHFYIDRRQNEQSFVTKRLGNYRDIVQDLVTGLKSISQRDQDTETGVREHLGAVENAVSSGDLDEIRTVVANTILNVADIFAEQKTSYESQIRELNDRLSGLREDLNQAQEEMQRDALTEAYNRRAFDAAIERALNMQFVLNQPVTLIMIDLDHFKAINDTYGHAIGDEVLRQIGEALARSFIRKSDLVARYGGDEFAVILTDTSEEHATPLLDRFLKRVAAVAIADTEPPLAISCSAGYTEIHSQDTAESAISRADQALYEAKRAGRNQYKFTAVAPAHD